MKKEKKEKGQSIERNFRDLKISLENLAVY
jgi:hypothetical protein